MTEHRDAQESGWQPNADEAQSIVGSEGGAAPLGSPRRTTVGQNGPLDRSASPDDPDDEEMDSTVEDDEDVADDEDEFDEDEGELDEEVR